jgi:hypothetical protein
LSYKTGRPVCPNRKAERYKEDNMDFKLTEREELLRKSMREFAEKEIPSRMEAMEETGEFPVDLLKKMGDVGILGVITPPEYGGTAMGSLARILILEEMGRVCSCNTYDPSGSPYGDPCSGEIR